VSCKLILLTFYLLFIGLGGCQAKTDATNMVGNDKNSHRCIPSAGYQWCGKENKCVRSWELAQEKNLTNTTEAFLTYCQQ
jgi:hypothetical protein